MNLDSLVAWGRWLRRRAENISAVLLLIMFRPDGLSGIAYGYRDQFLRWVAKRNSIHVQSLVADSLVTETAETEHALTEAVEHIEEVDAAPDRDVVRCPQCRALVPMDDVATHEHFRVEVNA